MATIDPLGPILAQLRAQSLAWRRKPAALESPPSEEPVRRSTGAAADVSAQITQAIVAIPRDDPARQRRAFRVYLEARLARECGISHSEEAGFQALIDRVLASMEADPRLNEAVRRAGELLLRSAEG